MTLRYSEFFSTSFSSLLDSFDSVVDDEFFLLRFFIFLLLQFAWCWIASVSLLEVLLRPAVSQSKFIRRFPLPPYLRSYSTHEKPYTLHENLFRDSFSRLGTFLEQSFVCLSIFPVFVSIVCRLNVFCVSHRSMTYAKATRVLKMKFGPSQALTYPTKFIYSFIDSHSHGLASPPLHTSGDNTIEPVESTMMIIWMMRRMCVAFWLSPSAWWRSRRVTLWGSGRGHTLTNSIGRVTLFCSSSQLCVFVVVFLLFHFAFAACRHILIWLFEIGIKFRSFCTHYTLSLENENALVFVEKKRKEMLCKSLRRRFHRRHFSDHRPSETVYIVKRNLIIDRKRTCFKFILPIANYSLMNKAAKMSDERWRDID